MFGDPEYNYENEKAIISEAIVSIKVLVSQFEGA